MKSVYATKENLKETVNQSSTHRAVSKPNIGPYLPGPQSSASETYNIQNVLTDFTGPLYPAPVDITSSNSLVSAAWKKFGSTLDAYLSSNQSGASSDLSGVENVTFSAGLFPVNDAAAAKLQYHYTSPEIKNAENGTDKVDGDSIYHLASICKLFTVLTGLIKLTNEDWNRPITEIIPEFNESLSSGDRGPQQIHWNEITPWTMAARIAGVPREGVPALNLLLRLPEVTGPQPDPVKDYGFPPVDLNGLGQCWHTDRGFCTAADYAPSVDAQPPVFLPWTSPAYADDGFVLLGLAIQQMLKKSMDDLYQETISEPLALTSSSSIIPTDEKEIARSVIPGKAESGFSFNLGITSPSGGLLSTINDLAKLGVGILNSTLLPHVTTRKWMKPLSYTASLSYVVGAPWEITRYVHPSTSRVTDLYAKSGDSGYYSSNIILIPDYNAGFTVLTGSVNIITRNHAVNTILDLITENVLPALEAQAAAQAHASFVGTYVSGDSTLNSTVMISFNESTVPLSPSGLSITNWISNGADVLASPLSNDINPRLIPSIPSEAGAGKSGQVAFQASKHPQMKTYLEAPRELGAIGPFTAQASTNFDWLSVDANHYAGRAAGLFVFDIDEKGRATGVSPAVPRARLERRE
ncbi:hypothetical protein ACLMJK_006693 [Lecanora helva]